MREQFFNKVMRHLRRAPLAALLVSGLLLTCAGMAIAWKTPAREVGVSEPVRRVSCTELSSLVEDARGGTGPGEVVVVLASKIRLYAENDASAGLGEPFTLSCDDIELTAEGNLFPGSPGIASETPSTLLVQLRGSGTLWIERYCIACEDAPIDSPPGRPLALLVLRLTSRLLGTIGLWLIFSCWLVRPRTLTRFIGQAPTLASEGTWEAPMAARMGHAGDDSEPRDLEGPHWSFEKGKIVPVEPDEAPRFDLPFPGSAFRGGRSEPPTFTGPGRVNGLEVPARTSVPLQHGDILRFESGPPLKLETPDHLEPTLRYHLTESGGWRILCESEHIPRDAGVFTFIVAVVTTGATVSIQSFSSVPVYAGIMMLVIAALFTYLIPALPTLRWLELQEREGKLRRGDILDDSSYDQVLLVEHEESGYDLVVSNEEGGTALTESSKNWQRNKGAEQEALEQAMLEEARLLATK